MSSVHPRRTHRLGRAVVVALVAVGGGVAGWDVASAHSPGSCYHYDHYWLHGGHYDYMDYNGGFWADGGHYHDWYNGSHATQHYDYCTG